MLPGDGKILPDHPLGGNTPKADHDLGMQQPELLPQPRHTGFALSGQRVAVLGRAALDDVRYKATKARQVQSRIKQLEKMEITELEGPQKSVSFKFPECPRSGREVIKAEGLEKTLRRPRRIQRREFRDRARAARRARRRQRRGQIHAHAAARPDRGADSGARHTGLNVKKAYFSQESAQNLDYSRTIWQEVNNTGSKLLEGEKRNLLGAFLFSGDEIHKPVSVLSGGEKSRLGLLKMLLSESNLLILDEPTNHLDYGTKELFQKALLEYGGTILIVSHDRAFLDDLVDRVLEIRDGSVYDYPGNYSWFIEKRAEREARAAAERANAAQPEKSENKTKEQKRAEAEERNRLYRAKKDFVTRLKKCEEEIAAGEARKEEINGLLCSQEVLSDSGRIQELMIELKEKENSLKALYDEWEELSIKIEEIK